MEVELVSRKNKAMRDGIQLSQAIARDGAAIFRRACWMDREGIVSKRIGSRYVSGRTRAWLKTKTKISCGERQVLDHSSPIIDLSSLRNKRCRTCDQQKANSTSPRVGITIAGIWAL